LISSIESKEIKESKTTLLNIQKNLLYVLRNLNILSKNRDQIRNEKQKDKFVVELRRITDDLTKKISMITDLLQTTTTDE
jgi:hypothetical protein